MFNMGIARDLWSGKTVGPMTVTVTRAEIDRDRAAVLKRMPIQKGWTGSYPYVVKVEGEGEYLVNADGSVQFWNARQGRWEPPEVIDNNSPFERVSQSSA